MYLLDTNYCSRIISGDPAVLREVTVRRRQVMATCIIVQGELLYMAYKSHRADANLQAVRDYLTAIQIHPIDAATADDYARIKAAILRRWGPREKSKQRHFTISHLGFTDNDIWIAAITLRRNLIVVSTDSDFARIAQVSELRHESWLPTINSSRGR